MSSSIVYLLSLASFSKHLSELTLVQKSNKYLIVLLNYNRRNILTKERLANLNVLTDYLSIQAPPSGFGLGSIGQNPNQAYGLALCRGDVSTPDCKTCVVEAGSEIRKRCPYDKGAIIWYDNCLFKYANMEFFGHVDNQNKFYMWNLNNVSEPQLFNAKTKELLSDLATQAYANPKMYAAGEMELYGSNKLYGLTQCAGTFPALSLPSCCDGKGGGRVVGGSCNFRYEIYPFVNA
ncbi:hypothetical protein ES319_A10G064200v1 [Gossypium barbadense]|uniref:Gnk2-homologous domain-containing protein n=2 Tax=Gossypium TaxID=3633 RepID=A0A5J5TZR9_GOSBA|nr:hypothetical protein ES319_A10G064200v1 [Gossypium barbadense]TYG97836.1 hypothetical protein ES288_A10G069200v1 [Gossypium darwinii]